MPGAITVPPATIEPRIFGSFPKILQLIGTGAGALFGAASVGGRRLWEGTSVISEADGTFGTHFRRFRR
jgi:hypothetical protein